jgi:hypothetical protein
MFLHAACNLWGLAGLPLRAATAVKSRNLSPPVSVGPLHAAITADPVTRASTGGAGNWCAGRPMT